MTGGAALTEKPFMPGEPVRVETLRTGDAAYQIRALLDLPPFSGLDGQAEQLGIFLATWPLSGLAISASAGGGDTHPVAGVRLAEWANAAPFGFPFSLGIRWAEIREKSAYYENSFTLDSMAPFMH